MEIVGRKRSLQGVQGLQRPVVIVRVAEGHIIQGGGVVIVLPDLADRQLLVLIRGLAGSRLQVVRKEGDLRHAGRILDVLIHPERLVKGDI